MRDLSLVYKDHLIISDLHIGFEEAMNKQGILIPRFQFEEIKAKITSDFMGFAERTSAGRTFAAERSVKGNGTSTTVPCLGIPLL